MLPFLAGVIVGIVVGTVAAVVCVAFGVSLAREQSRGTPDQPDHVDTLYVTSEAMLRSWRPSQVQ